MLLPINNKLPKSKYEIVALTKDLGMDVAKSYDACPNDCMLYYGDGKKSLDQCPECGEKRYHTTASSKKVGRKVLHHISLAPQFERLFGCKGMSELIDYHVRGGSTYRVMKIPVDALVSNLYGVKLRRSGQCSNMNHVMQ